jgi:hypothetical protein
MGDLGAMEGWSVSHMQRIFKDVRETAWTTDHFTIRGRKGTRVGVEIRENHIKGMTQFVDGEWKPYDRAEYLVFDLPHQIEESNFTELKENFRHLVLRNTSHGCEISFHYPMVYNTWLLAILKKLGFIAVTWKEVPREKGEFPLYINPSRGWQILYNLMSVAGSAVYKTVKKWRGSDAH